MTDQHGWAAITIEFLASTDSKTVGHVLERLRGFNVRLKIAGRPPQDMRVVSVAATRGDCGGFLFSPIGEDDEPTDGDQLFVGYDDTQAIGVY